MVAHSAESSCSVKSGVHAPRGWRNGTKPRVLSSIAAQWLIPTISALLLLSATVQRLRPYRSDTETCLPQTAIVPMSIETTEPCSYQDDISDHIMSIMNSHNYSLILRQAAINRHKQYDINNTDAISNETSLILQKIRDVLESLTPPNQLEERKQHHLSSFSTVSMLRNHRSVSENNSVFPRFDNNQDENEDNDYYNSEDENKDEIAPEYPNYEISDAETSTAPTETLYHYLNTDEEAEDVPNTNSIPPIHEQQEQQFEEDTDTSDITETVNIVISSSPSLAPQQTRSNFSTVQFSISPTTTSQSLSTANEDTSASSIMEESIISGTADTESSNFLSLPNVGIEATSPTSTIGNEITLKQSNTSTVTATESQITVTIKSSTEPQFVTQTVGQTHVQIPDTVNMCVVKCYFSVSFLKRYLFILLFLCYFVPILASLVMYVITDKKLTMIQSFDVKPTDEPTTTADEKDATNTACNMHLAKMVSASNTVKHLITTSILLWTPIFVEILLRVWLCLHTPQLLTTLLFVLGQANTIIRNAMNLQLIRSHACIGAVQPLQVEQGKENNGIPTRLFTKVKAVFL
jgi:hypothetical protein